jgi:membrane protein involved in colicin uptake
MASVDKQLELQLREAGNHLARLPCSADELLPLLDQVETCLSRVEQSPPDSMQMALGPSLDALVKGELLKHSDFDVKVAVASCISEITRITAPEAPYKDDTMKEVFHLIVSSFGNLSDKSSRSYNKMVSILETVAKVRSCVVMLDLECDDLIVEMFQHFLKSIRDYHSDQVFTSMETIMCLVLEESEDVSVELLTPLLDSVKNNSEEVKPISRKLGERVFETCAAKLKPYLVEAVESLGISVGDYSRVVASVYQGTSIAVEQNDDSSLEQSDAEKKLTNASSDEAAQVSKESVVEEISPEEPEKVEPSKDRSSPKSIVSNGVAETDNEETMADHTSSKEPENETKVEARDEVKIEADSKAEADAKAKAKAEAKVGAEVGSKNEAEAGAEAGSKTEAEAVSESKIEAEAESKTKAQDEAESKAEAKHETEVEAKDGAEAEAKTETEAEAKADVSMTNKSDKTVTADLENRVKSPVKPKPKQELVTKRKGKKTFAATGRSEKDEESEKSDVLPMIPSTENSDIKTEAGGATKISPEKALETDSAAPSASPSRTFSAESPPKKGARTKKKIVPEEAEEEAEKMPAVTDSPKKEEAEVASGGSQWRRRKQTEKKVSGGPRPKILPASKKESETGNELKQTGKKVESSESDAKPLKQSGKKGNSSINNNIEEKSSLRKKARKGKGSGGGKDTSATDDLTTTSKDDDAKETVSAPKSSAKAAKDEDSIEETPKTDAKRKRSTPGTGKNKGSTDKESGEGLVGLKVKVYWPKDREYYEGVIESYDRATKKHKVSYDDGDTEILLLAKEKWNVINDDPVSDEEKETEDPSSDASPDAQKKKKAKTSTELSGKKDKTPVSPKRSGAGADPSSKAKSVVSKSGGDRNNKSKVSGKSEENSGKNPQEKSKKRGGGDSGSFDDTLRSAMKVSKQVTPKTGSKSSNKGKPTKSGGSESNANGSGKAKSNEDSKAKATASAKTPDTTKSGGKKRKKRN